MNRLEYLRNGMLQARVMRLIIPYGMLGVARKYSKCLFEVRHFKKKCSFELKQWES